MYCQEAVQNQARFEKATNVCELIRENAETFPDHIAAVCGTSQITYRELEEKSNALASYLISLGYHREDIIGVATNRSVETAIAILGIWKAGAAYFYLNPAMPEKINQKIIQECRCVQVIDESLLRASEKAACPGWPIDFSVPDGLALIIYTSGSTAKPKGVMVEHRSVLAMVRNMLPMAVTREDRYCVFPSFSFIAAVTDLIYTLCAGATCYIIEEEYRRDIRLLTEYLCVNQITVCFLPPHMAAKLTQEKRKDLVLRLLLVGSDNVHHLKPSDHFQIIHVYGATEACSLIAHYPIESEQESYPVGRLNKGLRGYVVDEHGTPVKPGEIGELWLSGPQISRGYVNLREKTAAAFSLNPFCNGEKEYRRIYKTADLVRQDPEGNLVYVSRKDNMYKIRGFRVEARAVEQAILKFEGIGGAAVLAFPDSGGTNILCGYYTADRAISPKEIKGFLKELLPYYMVPTCMIQMDEFPMNCNNKLDRRRLAPPAELNDHKLLAEIY